MEVTDADIWRIVPKEEYGEENLNYYDSSTRSYIEQYNPSMRPEFTGDKNNINEYDTILLGYPIWYGKAPRIILTFLEAYKDELDGKTIIPFCTSGSSDISGSLPEIRNALPDSSVKDGFRGTANMTEEQIKLQLENNSYSFTKAYSVADITLNSGYTMPVLGLGTWTQNDETTANSVYHALKDGYRLIDTAQYYGNETGVGEGVRKAIDEGIVTRDEVFITSKVMPMNYDNAYASISQSNDKIGLGYIDLMLIHQSGSNDKQVYRALEQAVKDGTIKSLGISNYYTQAEFDRITEGAQIMPAVVQNENHPFYQNTALQEYVKQYGTVVESYYPLGGRGHTQDLLGNETINEIAEAHNKTAAQVILRWHIQAGYITIPGSSNPDHIAENYDIFDFELTNEEMQTLATLDTGNRYENW